MSDTSTDWNKLIKEAEKRGEERMLQKIEKRCAKCDRYCEYKNCPLLDKED